MNFILLPILLIPFTINSSSNSKFISSWSELKQAITTANDGDVLYVDDIDFESNTDGLYSEFERITINKSITLIGKPKIQCNHSQTTCDIFHQTRRTGSNICMEPHKILNRKINHEKEEKNRIRAQINY